MDMTGATTASGFEALAAPLRREIRLHCYRMLGALHEAEDAVQEAYLRGWRSFGGFDGRGTFRAWLYRIATNVCLDALAARKQAQQRLLPDLRAPAANVMPDGTPAPDVTWLEPYPDMELEGIADEAPGPQARLSSRQAVQLAFVAVIQLLPPRQRAVLLLCDVLGWSADEVATLLGGSAASVNSALQRARATLAKHYPGGLPPESRPPDAAQQVLLSRYLKAWETLDLDGFASLLKEDAAYTMPPLAQWFAGRDAIRGFFERAWTRYDGIKMVPTHANGQPAFAAYSRKHPDAIWTAHSLHVLTLEGDAIAAITLFYAPMGPALFEAFGLPLQRPVGE